MFTLADAIAAGARIDVAHVLRDLSAILLRAERGGYALRRLTAERVLCIGDARGVALAIDSWHDARAVASAPSDLGASVHALGMIALQIATGVMPYAAITLATLAGTATAHARMPARLAWLVERMLARDPADRPSLAEVHALATKLSVPRRLRPSFDDVTGSIRDLEPRRVATPALVWSTWTATCASSWWPVITR